MLNVSQQMHILLLILAAISNHANKMIVRSLNRSEICPDLKIIEIQSDLQAHSPIQYMVRPGLCHTTSYVVPKKSTLHAVSIFIGPHVYNVYKNYNKKKLLITLINGLA